MTDLALDTMPEMSEDETLNSLLETFNARLLAAESKDHYIGNVTTRVRIGEHEYLTLPTVRITVAAHKAELERARATMFATYLLQLGREQARELWKMAAPWEGQHFMAWVKLDIEWKRANGEHA
ncbi:hypothetical protein [Halomonas sp. NO4]|uniref:hypothetical protein n=1 Tax=Halomonas sp. NO4 TaxID=2484813 RepID=UPI0013D4F7CC|nr:hypothetical protein [Halomonas sp. NO4]